MLLRSLQQYLKSPAPRPIQFDEQQGFADSQPRQSTAQLWEKPMQAHAVGWSQSDPQHSEFTHFLDGIQRSWLLYSLAHVPIYYGYTSAVVRQRSDRLLHTWQTTQHEALFLPFAYIPAEELSNLQNAGVPLVNTLPTHPPDNSFQPLSLRESARETIAQQRQQLETQLAEAWAHPHNDGWLVVDGSINHLHPRTIGVIKSHNTQYFPFPEQSVILELATGQRSSIFQPAQREGICSWYLRLRHQPSNDSYFGLVRIEAPAKLASRADEISRWLMAERRPLSLPDSRWDRLIYPIRNCEQFLRSQEPRLVVF